MSDLDCSLQGYDDIPKEIPDPDAKKVQILLIPSYFYGTYSIVYTPPMIRSSADPWFHILQYLLQPEDWDDEEDGEWTAPTIPNPEYKGPWKQKVWTWLSGLIMQDKLQCHDTSADMSWSLCCPENQESGLQGQVEGPFDWQPRYIFLSILREAISPEANPTFHFSFYAYYES